jgi:hypothetical protein
MRTSEASRPGLRYPAPPARTAVPPVHDHVEDGGLRPEFSRRLRAYLMREAAARITASEDRAGGRDRPVDVEAAR